MGSAYLTLWMPSLSGNTNIVSLVSSYFHQTGTYLPRYSTFTLCSARPVSNELLGLAEFDEIDPNFYVPLSAIEAGEGQVSFPNDDVDVPPPLVHLGGVTVPGKRPPPMIALLNRGPLKGLVKIPFTSLGKFVIPHITRRVPTLSKYTICSRANLS